MDLDPDFHKLAEMVAKKGLLKSIEWYTSSERNPYEGSGNNSNK